MRGTNMAAEGSEYFEIGSTVWCKTCYAQTYEGEVVAFEPQTKMLILRCPSSCGRPNKSDVHMINVNLVEDLKVKSEVSAAASSLNNLQLKKLDTRLQQRVDQKRRFLAGLAANVPTEAKLIYLAISKTIDEVQWKGQDICIMEHTTISPPYKPEDVKGENEKGVIHAKKIVEKFWADNKSGNNAEREMY